tara:strand:+ start:2788 stop:4347 length:1560 start_codon:yes stop_codon:yes gene_type:complete
MSNLTTPPRAIFRQIQANLKDRYSSGFPVLKELIQNAEDARAGMIRFVAHEGWPEANNPLLRVPGLLVSNDGVFAERDGRGILSFADSAKGDDSGTIGRFGFGQKAVFHLCDAFIVHAFGHSTKFSEVVNPCLGVIENTKAATWEMIGREDLAKLHAACLGIDRGLLLWLPLRHDEILPAPKLTFIDNRPQLEDLIAGFLENRAELHLTLAGLRHLNRIELWRDATQIAGLCRDPDAPRMRGFVPAGELRSLSFKGTITEQGSESSTYVGREVSGAQRRLDTLRSSERWPQSPVFTEIGEEILPEKAEVHAAVILTDQASGAETLIDWAVFLPVGNAARLPSDRARVRLMLHGYFFVDSGRRLIEGFDASMLRATPSARFRVNGIPCFGTRFFCLWSRRRSLMLFRQGCFRMTILLDCCARSSTACLAEHTAPPSQRKTCLRERWRKPRAKSRQLGICFVPAPNYGGCQPPMRAAHSPSQTFFRESRNGHTGAGFRWRCALLHSMGVTLAGILTRSRIC